MAKRERHEENKRIYREAGFSASVHASNDQHRSRSSPVKRRKLFEKDGNKSRGFDRANMHQAGEHFRKLDPSIPEEDRRIIQRHRAVLKGKNTVGYDEYTSQVPRHERTIRHPRTPDHTVDIPNRRWLGLVKSWRIALHKYDPEDLQTEFNAQKDEKMKEVETAEKSSLDAKSKPLTVQERQIAEASTKGLLVDFGVTKEATREDADATGAALEKTNEPRVTMGIDNAMLELDKLEHHCDGDEEFLDYDDSDDDLL